MTKVSLVDILDLSCYLTVLLFVCCMESIFFTSTSFIVDIDVWIIPIIFYSLHRNQTLSVIFILVSSFIMFGFTGTPIFEILISLFSTHIFITITKNRSFTKGCAYFYLLSLFSILVFYSSIFLTNYIFYSDIMGFGVLILCLIIALTSPAFIFLFKPVFVLIDELIGVKYPFGFEA